MVQLLKGKHSCSDYLQNIVCLTSWDEKGNLGLLIFLSEVTGNLIWYGTSLLLLSMICHKVLLERKGKRIAIRCLISDFIGPINRKYPHNLEVPFSY